MAESRADQMNDFDGVAALARAVERLAGASSPEQVAEIVRAAARRLSGADGIAVVLREGARVRYVDEDAVGPLWKGRDFPVEACISGWAILHRERVVIPDVFLDARIPLELYRPTFVRSCVMTPVGAPEPIACIGAYWAEVREPTRRELDALDAIARATAVALENLRLQRSLREALRLAVSSSRAKSDFLTNMSHEIRTPLNGVVGALALLAGTGLTERQQELVEMLSNSAAGLDSVLKDVLDFARLQSETADLVCEDFDLEPAVREVARLFELRFASKGIDFRVEIDPAARRRVTGDRGAIKQVLANLVHNALKFTETGRVAISVESAAAGEMRFLVADTGVGMDEAVRSRIFESFEQADTSNTRAAGGVGLGLAICSRLVDLMGGSLSVESRQGAGSIFTVGLTLPEAAETAAPGTPPVVNLAAAAAERVPRILVVDDHPTNRAVASALLSAIGAETVEVADGQQACDAFVAQGYDAILMDIQMPVMDGLAATRKIRQIEANRGGPPTPILVLSANALPEHVTASRAAGADAYLAKPVSPALLYEALRDAIEGRRQAA